MTQRLRRARPLALAFFLVVAVVACDEQLEAGLACPALCPGQVTTIQDTLLFPVEFDTAVTGFPPLGTETTLLLANRGDTLDTRAVIRYDSLPTTFSRAGTGIDSAIVEVDTGSHLRLRIADADTLGPAVTVELYDVDVGFADDTAAAELLPLFTPARLLGSRTFDAESLKDSIDVPIDPAKLLEKIQLEDHLRKLHIGVRVSSTESAQLTIVSHNGLQPGRLRFRPSTDTTVTMVDITPLSRTPLDFPTIASDLRDFMLIASEGTEPPPDVMRIGGLPARRGYLRFAIPASILDSSSIVRATLFLTQRPNHEAANAGDSVAVQPFAITAGTPITDLRRALLFLQQIRGLDSVRTTAADSGAIAFEIIHLIRAWRFTQPERTPRALALRVSTEGTLPLLADFYSRQGPDAVKPRLRITFVPNIEPGIP